MTLLHAIAHPAVPEAEERRPLPTLIALHGHGAHAQDLLGLGTVLAHGRLLMICPQAEFAIEPGYPGYTWFRRGADDARAPGEVERVGALLWRFIDHALERYPVDPERVALLGFSQGGSLAYALALAEPARFAGLAALSTSLAPEVLAAVTPHRHEYLMGHQINNESARDLSLWLERVLRLDEPAADGGTIRRRSTPSASGRWRRACPCSCSTAATTSSSRSRRGAPPARRCAASASSRSSTSTSWATRSTTRARATSRCG